MYGSVKAIKLVGSKQRWVCCSGCDTFYKVVSHFKIPDGTTVECECSSCLSMEALAINPKDLRGKDLLT